MMGCATRIFFQGGQPIIIIIRAAHPPRGAQHAFDHADPMKPAHSTTTPKTLPLNPSAQLLLSDWRELREPFVLPLGLHHCAFEDWESIDCDLAACCICGAAHACDAATCPLVCTEGRQVCEITGFCVKNAVFENDPFSNTCCLKFPGADTSLGRWHHPHHQQQPSSSSLAGAESNPFSSSSSFSSCLATTTMSQRNASGAGGGGGKKRRCLERASMRLRDTERKGGEDNEGRDRPDNRDDSTNSKRMKPDNNNNNGTTNNALPHSSSSLLVITGAFPGCARRPNSLNEDQVGEWVHELLCSARTRISLEQEQRRRAARLNAIFTKLARKAHSHREPLNLVQACTTMAASMTTIRLPRLIHAHELRSVAIQCHEALVQFLRVFLERARATVPAVKTKGFVVGTLYLMRCGITLCDSVQVLAHVPLLGWVLPLENQLQPCFQLSAKIITEAENTIKSALRGLTRQELVSMGFTAY